MWLSWLQFIIWWGIQEETSISFEGKDFYWPYWGAAHAAASFATSSAFSFRMIPFKLGRGEEWWIGQHHKQEQASASSCLALERACWGCQSKHQPSCQRRCLWFTETLCPARWLQLYWRMWSVIQWHLGWTRWGQHNWRMWYRQLLYWALGECWEIHRWWWLPLHTFPVLRSTNHHPKSSVNELSVRPL